MFKPEKFTGTKACVLGLGRSGCEAARLLRQRGFAVLASEEKQRTAVPALPPGVTVETGGHSAAVFDCGFMVKSPGIFPAHPVLQEAKKRKIPVFSELEVALAFLPKGVQVLAVSGTNGKTTTTTLLGEILKEHVRQAPGRQVFVAGNIGRPVSAVVAQVQSGDFLVLEVSSYQLEDSTFFRPNVACLLNITPDHLDHHGGLNAYIRAKARLFKNQRAQDVAVLNGGDELCAQLAGGLRARVVAFSARPSHPLKTDVFYDGDEIIFSQGQRLHPPGLKGIHNIENAMAAALCAMAVGVPAEEIQRVFTRFQALEHRIEPCGMVRGICFINDSKATNLDSTAVALESFDKKNNVWLILGGRDKGASYESLLAHMTGRCKAVLTIGESMDKIEQELQGLFPLTRCGTLQQAVAYAAAHAHAGDIVLFSPACASFDQFKNFEERGRVFKKLVSGLK